MWSTWKKPRVFVLSARVKPRGGALPWLMREHDVKVRGRLALKQRYGGRLPGEAHKELLREQAERPRGEAAWAGNSRPKNQNTETSASEQKCLRKPGWRTGLVRP